MVSMSLASLLTSKAQCRTLNLRKCLITVYILGVYSIIGPYQYDFPCLLPPIYRRCIDPVAHSLPLLGISISASDINGLS